VVIPLVVYCGDAPWDVPREFADLLPDNRELRPLALNFRYQLLDVVREPEDRPSTNSTLRDGLRVMKRMAQLERGGIQVVGDSFRVAAGLPDEFMLTTLLYIIRVAGRLGADVVLKTMRSVMPESTQDVMSRAEVELEARGLAKGLARGRMEGRREAMAATLRLILEQRFGTVPVPLLARIEESDLALLGRWIGRAVGAARVEDVFAD